MYATCTRHACSMHAINYACNMHAICMQHACNMHAICMQIACNMHATCMQHACNMHANCMRQDSPSWLHAAFMQYVRRCMRDFKSHACCMHICSYHSYCMHNMHARQYLVSLHACIQASTSI